MYIFLSIYYKGWYTLEKHFSSFRIHRVHKGELWFITWVTTQRADYIVIALAMKNLDLKLHYKYKQEQIGVCEHVFT